MPQPPDAAGPRFTRSPRLGASEEVALELRRHIEEAGLRPGSRIGTEGELSVEFGVSRPTMREALRLLGGSHLISARRGPGGGVFVARTPNEGMGDHVSASIAAMLDTESTSLAELLDARKLLEVPLAARAADNADAALVTELEQAIDDAAAHRDPSGDAFRLADARFHEAIAAAVGNDVLVAFTRWALEVLQPSLVAHIGAHLDAAEVLDQHRAILRAIRRGQANAAARAMRAHLEHLEGVLARVDSAA